MDNTTQTAVKLNGAQQAFKKKMMNALAFNTFTLTQVPLGYLAGMRMKKLEADSCETTMPFTWLNKNPFKSIYFAAQSMAAELSTAAICMLAVQGYSPSVAFIIVDLQATFPKKATGKVTFTCVDGDKIFEAVRKAIETGEAATVKAKTVGKMKDGTIVSEFYFTWSFKQRSKKK
ncbi:DUF4442 domain-containing protein [Limibacter armeniacum]|uniref:DUF4442 domain-containing protein n=1 Tax=Limibacter armeniacum TaxID=466084 RepID=UPI002FE57E33